MNCDSGSCSVINLSGNNVSTSDTIDIPGITVTTTFTSKKCFFCGNPSVITIDYEGRELCLCETHRDALKGRLGNQEYIPYYPYTPVQPGNPWWGSDENITCECEIDRS